MKLVEVSVERFKNILESNPVAIQPDITCMVGKNESGKTAFLHALYRLSPARQRVTFSILEHYPAWLEKKHRNQGQKLEDVKPVRGQFELEEADVSSFEGRFGGGSLLSKALTIRRSYEGTRYFDYKIDQQKIIQRLLTGLDIPTDLSTAAASLKTFSDLDGFLKALEKLGDAGSASLKTLRETIAKTSGESKSLTQSVIDHLDSLAPRFFYFDEYSALPGIVKIRELLEKNQKDLTEEEATARSLLTMAGTEDDYLLHKDFEVRHRELENVGNALSADVLDYWSTNKNLHVQLALTQKNISVQGGQQSVLDELRIRLYDNSHMLSLPFDERSSGFRWFFSFLAAFSEFERNEKAPIILLDEPGVGLHARAQADFLKFIEERLSKKCQIVYTTHSPFMVQANHLERVRLVEDKGRDIGTRITADILATDKDTLFPLQGALGYDLAQNLFVAPYSLVVEGTSDFVYLSLMSEILKDRGREALDERWSIVPVGGADLVPTFVALLGGKLEMTVIVDSRRDGHQKLFRLADQKLLERSRIVVIGEVLGQKLGDIEDLFELAEYLTLYNKAFGASIQAGDLRSDDPIVSRIARHINVDRFDHGKPADVLMRDKAAFVRNLSDDTLGRFEALFKRVNRTLK